MHKSKHLVTIKKSLRAAGVAFGPKALFLVFVASLSRLLRLGLTQGDGEADGVRFIA